MIRPCCSHGASALHRLASIGDGFALRCASGPSASMREQKMRYRYNTITHPIDIQHAPLAQLPRTARLPTINVQPSPPALVHPALSSLEACPTPARETLSCHRASATEGRHQTTLNRSGSTTKPLKLPLTYRRKRKPIECRQSTLTDRYEIPVQRALCYAVCRPRG
jgi:hypothetical protein